MKSDDHDRGLAHDLAVLSAMTDRRQALRLLAGMSLLPLFGCSGGGDTGAASSTGDAGSPSGTDGAGPPSGTCPSKIPEETAGPFPGDGSNGPNVLAESGVVRSDIRSSIGAASGVAAGVPLTITMKLVNASSCASLAGYAIYIWHCDRDGNYSMYSAAVSNENYLRGVQEADASGTVTFTTIVPGAYPGRWPHIHFEVHASLASVTATNSKVATSQLAFPKDMCDAAYATAGYEQSTANFAGTSLASDNVFSEGASLQLPSVTGDVATGFVATVTVAVAG